MPNSPIALIAGLVAALSLTACGPISITFDDGDAKVKGSGVAATESRSVAAFTAIENNGVGTLRLKVGEAESLKVTADDNMLAALTSEVRNGVLVLSTRGAASSHTPIVFTITARNVTRIENSGAGTVEASGFSGGDLTVDTSGVGRMALSGRVNSFKLELSGVGSLDAEALIADRVEAEVSGVGSASLHADKTLRGSVSGVGSVTWKGSATDVSTSVSGVGRVSKG